MNAELRSFLLLLLVLVITQSISFYYYYVSISFYYAISMLFIPCIVVGHYFSLSLKYWGEWDILIMLLQMGIGPRISVWSTKMM